MARISLRAYQRDIEELVETHQFDQAIAHCRHILRFYPKEVNTYRLLGKAYLESQRYGDASDIFIRVLSTVPDDFVSHVGMSIIREDEANLDEAIWHMQRAFETQPANSAIQGELRRLHGRREGIEPPKIRLTRGALARMYLKGELYAQALAELRAGLHEDSKRYDLQVVLAQAYYLAGQRVDAAEACSTLLKSLPFCLEANKILAEILSHSERADEAQVYAKRVQSLDPYMAHLTPAASTPERVADTAVLLEKLEWRPGIQTADVIQQPEWATSLGVDLGSASGSESLPDWLGGTEAKATQKETESKPFEETPASLEEAPAVVDDAVPDWMKDAGWTESQATRDQEEFLPLSEADGLAGDLEPADIPDWLKTMAPSGSAEIPAINPPPEPETLPADETEQVAVSPWLEETPPGPTDSVAMWLENQESPANADDQLDLGATNIDNIPDWLQDLGEPVSQAHTLEAASTENESEAPLPRDSSEDEKLNLGAVAGFTATAVALSTDHQAEETMDESPAGLADEIQPETVVTAQLPDWLQELKSVDIEPEPAFSDTDLESIAPSLEEPLAEAQIPEWLQNLEPLAAGQASELPDHEEMPSSESSLPIEVPIDLAAAVLATEAISDDWVTEKGGAVFVEEPPDDTLKAAMPAEAQSIEDDEAFAWLENLAARQGADEALLLKPDERRETPPEWILTEVNEQSAPEAEAGFTAGVAEAAILAAAIPEGVSEDNESVSADDLSGLVSAVEEEPGRGPETATYPEPLPMEEAIAADTEIPGETLVEVTEIVAAPEAPSGMEPAAEEEMLFYPLETAEAREQPLTLEEAPIAEGDTKPTVVVQAGSGQKLEAITVTTAVIGAVAESDEGPTPTPSLIEDEASNVPELVEEQHQPVELVATAEVTPEASYELEKPIAAGVVIPEDDEAFAWLESLAVRQGAEEALLLTPEERLESPPEWVMEEVAEAEEAQAADTPVEAEVPEWLQEAPLVTEEIEPAAGTESGVPDWLKRPAAISEEPPVEEELPPLAPELPIWLAGVEDNQKASETVEWSPTEESFEAVEPEALPDISEAIPEAALEEAPAPALDLNQAGLIDLERLPGIGFTRAQAILDYREKHGPYQEVDELLLVTGIAPDMLVELKQYLRVGGMEDISSEELPAEDQQILLVQARNALVQGDIPLAISRYSLLIDKDQMLPEVITDLNEALYRFPIDVSIWEALGDAHMHTGHLQDALNAYTKAEEYLH